MIFYFQHFQDGKRTRCVKIIKTIKLEKWNHFYDFVIIEKTLHSLFLFLLVSDGARPEPIYDKFMSLYY